MNNSEEEISQSLQKVLDSHGYSFQSAVIKRFEDLRQAKKSKWLLVGTEIPVKVKNQVIHIDLLFKHEGYNIYLIGECKRVNPALAHWGLVSDPFAFKLPIQNCTYFDFIQTPFQENSTILFYGCKIVTEENSPAHIGLELRTNKPGDGNTGDKSPINSAVTQVLRSSSGVINYLFNLNQLSEYPLRAKYAFVPVVFTTAELWYSSDDISEASLMDGTLPKDHVRAEKVNWLWFNHNRSSELMHNLERYTTTDVYKSIDREFTRSVAIVSHEGIDEFLGKDWDNWYQFWNLI